MSDGPGISFGDRSWSSIAAALSKSRSRTFSQRQILRNWVATKAGSQRQGWCCDPPILLPGLACPTAQVGVCKSLNYCSTLPSRSSSDVASEADGKPCVIGNCQAGWAVMMLAAIRPELFGPIIIAGSPLSYWAGVHGKNPMRYSGGLLGGSWLTAFTSDLGHGKFDGAWLVQNFENQNPANTLWTKQYNLYSK